MKYLIVGLGNPGDEYQGTRHNIGFTILDALAKASNIVFQDKRYGYVAYTSIKNRQLILLKPTTFMNLSGNAVRYWLNQEKVDPNNLLIIADDLALPLGKIRLKGQGSNGGHNGLGNIIQVLNSQKFARLRFGIGNNFPIGTQIQFVLNKFSDEEQKILDERIEIACEATKNFCLSGIEDTMCKFNNK